MWYPDKERTDQLDRELQELAAMPPRSEGEQEQFLIRISACIRFLAGHDETPPSYLRDWIWIGSQYRIRYDYEDGSFSTARAYLLQLERFIESLSSQEPFPVKDIRWITESGVASLRVRLGLKSANSFLSKEECERVETKLKHYQSETTVLTDHEINSLSRYVSLFSDVRSEIYHPAIKEMIDRLMEMALKSSGEQQAATGCLRYVLDPNDVVPDALGYLGLVDDIYAIEETLRMVGHRSTWEPLLDHFYENWPFIDRVSFKEPAKTTRLPAYLQIIVGHSLRGASSETQCSCIVLPEVGATGILVAFFAAIEFIANHGSQGHDSSRFEPGENIVLKGGDRSIRAICGEPINIAGVDHAAIILRDGVRARIEEVLLTAAQKAGSVHTTLSTNKQFEDWKQQYSPPPLTHIVGSGFSLDALKPSVLLLTRKKRLDQYMDSLRPMYQSIGDLVGLTYVTSGGAEQNFGDGHSDHSVIWACSDPVTARDLLQGREGDDCFDCVVSDEGDLARDLEDLLPSPEQRRNLPHISISGLHERDAIRGLLDRGYQSWLLRESDVRLSPSLPTDMEKGESGEITRYSRRQMLQSIVTSETHLVRCEAIEFLYLYLDEIRRLARGRHESYLDMLIIALSRYIRRFGRWPLEFGELEFNELRRLLRNLSDTCSVLVDFDPMVREVYEFVQKLMEDEIPKNPRIKKIRDLVSKAEGNENIAIVGGSEQASAMCAERVKNDRLLGNVNWVTLRQLESLGPVDKAIVPAWIDRKSMREIRNSGYAKHFDFVLYEFESEWDKRSRNASLAWERYLSNRMLDQWSRIREEFGDVQLPTDISRVGRTSDDQGAPSDSDDEQTELVESRIVERIRAQTAERSVSGGVSKAQLVTFEDTGSYVYLTPRANVISVSHAFEAGQESDTAVVSDLTRAEHLFSTSLADIVPGNLLAFPVDSTSDLLDDIGDRLIQDAKEIRRLAGLWRVALWLYVERHKATISQVQRDLERAGLKRTPVTVGLWVSSDRIIAPQSYPEALPIIARVTGYRELTERMEEVIQAIDLLYRARTRAAGELLKQLASKKIHLDEGWATVRIEGHDITYQLQRVLSVGPVEEVPNEVIGIVKNLSEGTSELEAPRG